EAELYLRMLVERVLLDGVRRHPAGGYAPAAAAAALVAVGAIKAELAEDVLIDFDLACMLRGGGGPGVASRARASMQAPPSAPGKAWRRPRVAPCRAEFALPWGNVKVKVNVRHVLLSDVVTTIGITSSETYTGSLARSDRYPHMQVSVSDDQGTTVTAHFSGKF